MDGLTGWTPTAGAPQGAVISPPSSNIYLDPWDHLMAASGIEMVRYADDLVILCRSREDAECAPEMMRRWVAEAGLTLHPQKTKIVHAESEGFEFLGYRFENRIRFPRAKSLTRLKTTIRSKPKRTNGHSLGTIIHDVNRTLRGWFEYFKRSNSTPFRPPDGWIRMRLRSLLRRRSGGKGRGHGRDHQRWPNASFAERGLFCLTTAHATYRQSAVR